MNRTSMVIVTAVTYRTLLAVCAEATDSMIRAVLAATAFVALRSPRALASTRGR